MTISRQPGDVSVKTRKALFTRTRRSNGTIISSVTTENFVEYDRRPTYLYGAKTTLPGGSKFVKPTSYSHSNWETRVQASAHEVYRSGTTLFDTWDEGQDLQAIASPGSAQSLAGSGVLTDARNEAVTKALNKIADQKVNLGENLATFRQTLGMFVPRAKALANALHIIRRDRRFVPLLRYEYRMLKESDKLKKLADLYLEYIYGLKPLMDDVYTGYRALQEGGLKDLVLSSRGTAQRTIFEKEGPLKPGSTCYFKSLSKTADVKVTCTLNASLDPNHQGLRLLNRVGLLNPLGLTWDLIPYSFVVDWFVPIGPVLYALSAPAGLNFLGGSVAQRASDLHQSTWTVQHPDSSYQTRQPGYCSLVGESYVRQALTSWPIPGFWASPDPFAGDRTLKALALSISALRGRPPIR